MLEKMVFLTLGLAIMRLLEKVDSDRSQGEGRKLEIAIAAKKSQKSSLQLS